jgi:hypothetical protein
MGRRGGEITPRHDDARTRGGWHQPADYLEQRGFAGAIGAQDNNDLATTDIKRDVIECAVLPIESGDSGYLKHRRLQDKRG